MIRVHSAFVWRVGQIGMGGSVFALVGFQRAAYEVFGFCVPGVSGERMCVCVCVCGYV